MTRVRDGVKTVHRLRRAGAPARQGVRSARAAPASAALAPSLSQAQALDLSRYSLSATYNAIVSEASSITYNWDNDSLFIVGDSLQFSELTKTGKIVSRLDLSGMATKIEGVTVDNDGVIYLVAESGAQGGPAALLVLTAPVPEPEAYAMMLAGLAAIGAFARRRRTSSRAS